jgi:hypothetical protein
MLGSALFTLYRSMRHNSLHMLLQSTTPQVWVEFMANNERRGLFHRLGDKLNPSRSQSRGNASRASSPAAVAHPDSGSPPIVVKAVASPVPPPSVPGPNTPALTTSKSAPPQPAQTGSTPSVVITTSLTASTKPHLILEEERSKLWKRAYQELKKKKPKLVQNYEIVIADTETNPSSVNVPVGDSLDDEEVRLSKIANIQKERMENRQWTWAWLGSDGKIRDTVNTILKVVTDSSALVSTGMAMAPPHVSLAWSAVCALLPVS